MPATEANPTASARAANVRLLALDVDGTMTDGRIIIGANGELAKSFSVHDGQGIRLLVDNGVQVALITARQSDIVAARASELQLDHVLQGVADKAQALAALCEQQGIAPAQAAFMGDDLPDLRAMQLAGLAACVANAVAEVRASAQWCASAKGGQGAVRELSQFILSSQNRWHGAIARFTNPRHGS